jgi:hypothetical protein
LPNSKFHQKHTPRILPTKSRLRDTFPSTSKQSKPLCFFCDAPIEQHYHKAATKKLDDNVRKMAMELQDTQLLAKLSSGDMVAMDAILPFITSIA